MSGWLQGKVLENRAWTGSLFSLRVQAPPLAFEAGQFVRIGLDIGAERVARPFSFVNAPRDPVFEFYGVVVPEGQLSPRLGRLAPGDPLWIADNPSGFLVLPEVPPAEDLWLVATGTGIAPFLSILRTEAPWQRYKRVILVHGARVADEWVYQDLIGEIGLAHPGKFHASVLPAARSTLRRCRDAFRPPWRTGAWSARPRRFQRNAPSSCSAEIPACSRTWSPRSPRAA
jgi:ferredoxin--NADP+ reductase